MLALALDQQRHSRFTKSHLRLDALPCDPRRRFLYIVRYRRDVAMSLWNHYLNWSDKAHALVNQLPNERGESFPLPPGDVQTFFDGWPYWSFFHNVQTSWYHHHQANILLLHFSDLLADLPARSPGLPPFSASRSALSGLRLWQQWALARRTATRTPCRVG